MSDGVGWRVNRKDLYAGLVFTVFGAIGLVVGREYPLGTTIRMGPGYFPMFLSGLLLLLGITIAVRAFWLDSERVGRLALRPLIMILISAASFAVLVEKAGLFLSAIVLIVLSSLGGRGARPFEVFLLSILLSGLTVAVFVIGLGLPLEIWIP